MNSTKTKTANKVQKPLKSSDICRIIDACKKAGVREFRFGALSLTFDEPGNTPSWPKSQKSNSKARPPSSDEEKGIRTPALSPEELEELNLRDPSAYERAILGEN